MTDPAPARPARRPHGGAAYLWMAASAGLFASMNVFARVASAQVHWTTVAAIRSLLGAALGIAVARARSVPALVAPTNMMWLRSLFGTAAMAFTFAALADRRMPLADTAALLNLSPVFIAVLAPLVLRERAGHRAWLALPLSAAGVTLILRPPALFGHAGAPAPGGANAVCVAASLSSALALMALRRTRAGDNPEAIAVHFSLTGLAAMGLVVGARRAAGLDAAPLGAGEILPSALAGLCGGAAQLAMTRAFALERAARLGPLGYLAVAFSALFGWALLGEPLGLTSLVGISSVVAGGLVLAWMGVRDAASAAPGGSPSGARP